MTGSRSEIVYRGAADRRSPGAPARHHAGKRAARLGAEGRAARRPADDDRAGRRRAAGRRRRLSGRRRGGVGRLRIAHLTATFPPYPGGAGNTAFRFARGRPSAATTSRSSRRPPRARPRTPAARSSTGSTRLRDRQRAADPEPRADRRLRRRPPPLPVHLRLRADAARPPAARRRRQALLVHYKNRLIGKGPARALVRGLRAHRRAGPDPRRRPGLRALRGPRRVGVLPAARRRASDPAKLIEMPNGVDAELFSPGPDDERAARAARDPGRRGGRRVRRHARPRPPLQAPRRRDRRPRRARARRVHLVVAGGGELLDGFRARRRGRGRRARPLPRRRPPRRAAGRAAGGRPVPAHDRAAGVVRDRPDRGDGLRAAGDRHRLPRRARRRRRGRDRPAGPAGRPGAVAAALGRLVGGGTGRAGRGWAQQGGEKARARVELAALVDRMDAAYAEAIAGRRRRRTGDGRRILLVAYFYPPSRDTGALRPAAMAKWLRRLGHEVTVLTTSAYGGLDRTTTRAWCAPRDVQRLAGPAPGPRRDRRDVRLPHLQRQPAPAQQGARPRAAGRRLAAVRALARRCRSARTGFDCVITTSPPESAHAIGRALQRRGVPWVADVRDGWTFEPLRPRFPTAPSDGSTSGSSAAGSAPPTRRLRQPRPAAEDLRRRGIADPLLIPNGWDPDARRRRGHRRCGACSTPTGRRSSTRAASAATAAIRPPLVEAMRTARATSTRTRRPGSSS